MAVAEPQPADFKRRSFVAPRLVEAGATFEPVNGAAAAVRFRPEAEELEIAERCGLVDLSPLPRFGIKGRGAVDWLTSQGMAVPEVPNTASRLDDGALAARLSASEVLVLSDFAAGPRCDDLETAWQRDREAAPDTPRGYAVPRCDSHCWFAVTGRRAAEMFAKICAVDLRPHHFGNLSVAQTSAARVGVVVIRHDLSPPLPGYHVLADSASACYLWDCLVDAMAEFDGGPVGLATLRRLV